LTLADMDDAIGQVLDAFWTPPGQRERMYVILTSDHGEALGDHGHKTHASSLYNSEIRVPLIVTGPDIPKRRVERPVGLHDLAPTILDLAGYVPSKMPAMDGVSIAPVARGEAPDDLASGEAYAAMIRDRSISTERRALISGRYKLLWRADRKAVELYDIVSDPAEKTDLAASQPDVVARLRAHLDARRALDSVDPF
jgi:arylsulfatase A-like enzyme